jgi:hypothetical protein
MFSPTIKQVWIHEKRPVKPEFSESQQYIVSQLLAHTVQTSQPSTQSTDSKAGESADKPSTLPAESTVNDNKENALRARLSAVIEDKERLKKQLEAFKRSAFTPRSYSIGRFDVTDS